MWLSFGPITGIDMKKSASNSSKRSNPKSGMHIAILGLGPSLDVYSGFIKRLGGRRKFSDETWGINAVGDLFQCDRIFHMDDVRIQEIRSAADPNSNIAAMLKWMRIHPGPIYTSRCHPDYPGLVPYPLGEVITRTNYTYFNSTVAYAVAYAIYLGVSKISLFGLDFTYENAHHAEKGRANVEFYLGMAAARGIKISIPKRSSLMDACNTPADRLYGYDTVDVSFEWKKGKATAKFKERDKLPTAKEIEHRYDHNRHPSPLIDEVPKPD